MDDFKIDIAALVEVELDLGFELSCVLEIVRAEPLATGCFYGARYVDLASDKANSLRAFVLKTQVEHHFMTKREDTEQRLFN